MHSKDKISLNIFCKDMRHRRKNVQELGRVHLSLNWLSVRRRKGKRMQVTKHNFDVVFPKFVEALETAEFYAVDCEMSGIGPARTTEERPDVCPFLSLPSSLFNSKNCAAKRYAIVQVGVSLFHRIAGGSSADRSSHSESGRLPAAVFVEDDEDSITGAGWSFGGSESSAKQVVGEYDARSFNFYIFPADGRDVVLNSETVSKFLASHGMDFTRWISEGIPYVSVESAAKIRSEGARNAEISFAERLHSKDDMKTFVSMEAKARRLASTKHVNDQFQLPFFCDMKSVTLAYELLASLGLTVVTTMEGNRKRKMIQFGPAGKPSATSAVDSKLGATLLFEALVKSQKPLIVHNGILDLLFLYHAFNEAPLETYDEFKKSVQRLFPVVYDTRMLFTLPWVLKETADIVQNLAGQYQFMNDKYEGTAVKIGLPFGFEQFHPAILQHTCRGAHEAAYDAFMTGSLFLYLLAHLGADVTYHVNCLSVYGSIYSCALDARIDHVKHNGDILWLPYGTERSFTFARVDAALKAGGVQGRILTSSTGSVAFCASQVTEQQIKKIQQTLGIEACIIWSALNNFA